MAHQITVEMFGCGVFDALFQALHRHFLRCHIDNQYAEDLSPDC